ncbi:hypothetical protein CTRI78_v008058 [Colletotrichum trifolii]|uniref:Uncharacterized protein n=1 Tax=Colletotrichum trifolii TaxID=5466 RepID=A0A4R8R0F9_COLTR|nr:hypothetical protein CTRI78_v008058 [Colletotrichum trifolii]
MTRLEEHVNPYAAQRRLILKNVDDFKDQQGVADLSARGLPACGSLEAVCKLLAEDISSHAAEQPLTREQATYLVGWHDALQALVCLTTSLEINNQDPLLPTTAEEMPPSFSDDVSLQEAIDRTILQGQQNFLNHTPEARKRLNLRTGVRDFNYSGRAAFAPDSYPQDDTLNSSFSSLGININDDSHARRFVDHLGSGDGLNASKLLSSINTSRLLLLHEKEARLSERKIVAELAKSSIMRQAIFQDRLFGDVPCLGEEDEATGIDAGFAAGEQEAAAIRDVRAKFREWSREEAARRVPSSVLGNDVIVCGQDPLYDPGTLATLPEMCNLPRWMPESWALGDESAIADAFHWNSVPPSNTNSSFGFEEPAPSGSLFNFNHLPSRPSSAANTHRSNLFSSPATGPRTRLFGPARHENEPAASASLVDPVQPRPQSWADVVKAGTNEQIPPLKVLRPSPEKRQLSPDLGSPPPFHLMAPRRTRLRDALQNDFANSLRGSTRASTPCQGSSEPVLAEKTGSSFVWSQMVAPEKKMAPENIGPHAPVFSNSSPRRPQSVLNMPNVQGLSDKALGKQPEFAASRPSFDNFGEIPHHSHEPNHSPAGRRPLTSMFITERRRAKMPSTALPGKKADTPRPSPRMTSFICQRFPSTEADVFPPRAYKILHQPAPSPKKGSGHPISDFGW